MPPDTRSVTVALRVGSDPINGSVVGHAGVPRPFSGWLELIAALQDEHERAIEEEAPGGCARLQR